MLGINGNGKKEPWNKIGTLLRIRNAFAHTNPIYFESYHRESLEDEGTHLKDILVVENKHGVIDKISWKKLLKEYRAAYEEIYEILRDKSREESKKWGQNVFAKFSKVKE